MPSLVLPKVLAQEGPPFLGFEQVGIQEHTQDGCGCQCLSLAGTLLTAHGGSRAEMGRAAWSESDLFLCGL